MLGLGMSTAASAQPSEEILLNDRCTPCHTADRFLQANKSAAGWKVSVDRMIQKGAKLSAAEREALLAYLNARKPGPSTTPR